MRFTFFSLLSSYLPVLLSLPSPFSYLPLLPSISLPSPCRYSWRSNWACSCRPSTASVGQSLAFLLCLFSCFLSSPSSPCPIIRSSTPFPLPLQSLTKTFAKGIFISPEQKRDLRRWTDTPYFYPAYGLLQAFAVPLFPASLLLHAFLTPFFLYLFFIHHHLPPLTLPPPPLLSLLFLFSHSFNQTPPYTPPPTLTPYLFPAAPSTSSPPSFYYLLSLGALPSSPSTKLPSPTSPPQPNAHSFNQTLPPYPLLYLLCLNQVAPLPLGLSESSASIGFPA